MTKPLNTTVDFIVDATYTSYGEYGKIIIGNNGFEFYSNKKAKNFVQIPWREIDQVIASVYIGGRWIPRFAIRTKSNGTFTFTSKKPKKLLQAIHVYIPSKKMVRSLTFMQVLKRKIKSMCNS